jgi:alpha-ketoglutarate-dependent taurine dioxygenase
MMDMDSPKPSLSINRITSALGAEIAGVDLATLDDPAFAAIHAAFMDHQVLVFRGQSLTPGQYTALARRFGEPAAYPFAKGLEGHPEITMIVKEADQTSNFGGMWHADTTYKPDPPKATMLMAVETPPVGGDTLFACQYTAYAPRHRHHERHREGRRDPDRHPSGGPAPPANRPLGSLCQPLPHHAFRRHDARGKRAPAGVPVRPPDPP